MLILHRGLIEGTDSMQHLYSADMHQGEGGVSKNLGFLCIQNISWIFVKM